MRARLGVVFYPSLVSSSVVRKLLMKVSLSVSVIWIVQQNLTLEFSGVFSISDQNTVS
jgi:hypothetical protein